MGESSKFYGFGYGGGIKELFFKSKKGKGKAEIFSKKKWKKGCLIIETVLQVSRCSSNIFRFSTLMSGFL